MNLMESSLRSAVCGNGSDHNKSACNAQGGAEPSKRESGYSEGVALYRPVPDSRQAVPDTDNEVPDSAQVVPDTGVEVPDTVASRTLTIFEQIDRQDHGSASEVATLLAVKERRARAVLKEMMDRGFLEQRGTARQTVYMRVGV